MNAIQLRVFLVLCFCAASSLAFAQTDVTIDPPTQHNPAEQSPETPETNDQVDAIDAVDPPDSANAEDATEKDSEEDKGCAYKFTLEYGIDSTPVKSQGATGTCWSFATTSFLESELMRRDKGVHDLSEMFMVKNIYRQKAINYVLRKGKANFSQGALAHDFINSAAEYGLMPEEVYDGKGNEEKHNHGELEAIELGMLQAIVKRPRLTPKWRVAFDRVLDTYLGESPENFTYRDKSYTAKEFAQSLDFRRDDYISLTSYTHHPFFESFIFELPDNFSNGSFYNVPIDDLMESIDHAIENGFGVAWDADISEKGFSQTKGIAVLPKDPARKDVFKNVGEEVSVDQELRQSTFMSLATTDDHLMHLTGIVTDTEGNKYYRVKNSWGEKGPYKGYLYASESYVRLKTLAILVHRDALPPRLRGAK